MAKVQWEQVLEIDVFNFEAQEKLDTIDIAILKTNASELKAKTLDTLNNIGPESARLFYSQTVQIYERILSLNPYEEGISDDLNDLKRQFMGKDQASSSKGKPIKISEIKLENIFPSLMQYYRKNPVGSPWKQFKASQSRHDTKWPCSPAFT